MSRLHIDPESKKPASTQLVTQLRYLIVRGHYAINETLPSTRSLGDQLDISFHTVRKAYQKLEEEGLIDAHMGSGYTVKARTPLKKRERMERGAKVIHDTLQHLVGLGLSDGEIETLFREQATQLDHSDRDDTLILVGPYPELNRMYAEQLGTALQRTVLPTSQAELDRRENVDYAFAPYPYLGHVRESLPQAETLGFVTHLPTEVLDQVASLPNQETLGLITRYQDTIPPLSEQLQTRSAYDGQIQTASLEEDTDIIREVIDQTDLLLYTPSTQDRLRSVLPDSIPSHHQISLLVSQDSIDALTDTIPN